MICIAEKYSRGGGLNAKQAYRLIKDRLPQELQKRGEDEFYRAVRYRVERMSADKRLLDFDHLLGMDWLSDPNKLLSIRGPANRAIFRLNRDYQKPML